MKEVFISYAREDTELLEELLKHLSVLQRDGSITIWYDERIRAGDEWEQKIRVRLDAADIVLLLVSPDFSGSEYCHLEMMRALERHDADEARVIPVILRPVDWRKALPGKLEALPKDGQPITAWTDRDAAFADVASGLREVLNDLEFWELEPKYLDARRRKDFDKAVELGERMLALRSDDVWRKSVAMMHVKRGQARLQRVGAIGFGGAGGYVTRESYERALPDFDRAVTLCPEAHFYYCRGHLHAERVPPEGKAANYAERQPLNYRRALDDFTRAIELDPGNGLYYNARADLNDPAAAMPALRPLDDSPARDDPVTRRRKEQAEADRQRAIEVGYLDPKTGLPNARYGLE